jgi:catechol 2,3-dioxygenase-like lactoylglutathione lyase family enzyme
VRVPWKLIGVAGLAGVAASGVVIARRRRSHQELGSDELRSRLHRRLADVRGMKLVEGVHHVTFLTEDIDRLVAFYERVFEARKTLDLTEEGLRHAFLEVGPTTVLHPFQILEGPDLPPAPGTMFQRGRLDHFALWAPTKEAFIEIRRRIESEGAADGDVRDMKTMWIMGLHDPDRFYVEVIWRKPEVPDSGTLPRTDWRTVELS